MFRKYHFLAFWCEISWEGKVDSKLLKFHSSYSLQNYLSAFSSETIIRLPRIGFIGWSSLQHSISQMKIVFCSTIKMIIFFPICLLKQPLPQKTTAYTNGIAQTAVSQDSMEKQNSFSWVFYNICSPCIPISMPLVDFNGHLNL